MSKTKGYKVNKIRTSCWDLRYYWKVYCPNQTKTLEKHCCIYNTDNSWPDPYLHVEISESPNFAPKINGGKSPEAWGALPPPFSQQLLFLSSGHEEDQPGCSAVVQAAVRRSHRVCRGGGRGRTALGQKYGPQTEHKVHDGAVVQCTMEAR